MRLLLAGLMMAVVMVAAPTKEKDRAARLEDLKRQFPSHIAGPITPRSDPAVQECFNRYESRVKKLTLQNLPSEVLTLQNEADGEGYSIDRRISDPNNVLTGSARHAATQNLRWLRQKLIPYLKRLAQFQRGN